MLQHLSATSPYVCDLNRGPIEPANRMASTSTTKLTTLLESKECSPKARTPLKLLHLDEVPMDTTAAVNDINASLQPVWYTEQTIVDDHPIQQEDNLSVVQEKTHTTLPPIQSESPLIDEEDELPANEPSLMHKSSTFTVESSMNIESALNDLEKENVNKEEPTAAPSDESFRALEQLLGLGSATTTMRESPKPSQDTLSLTVVTPTDIVNSTRRSSRLSVARKTITDSLPSSQEIPKMPTIESITSINLPSFLADNTTMGEEQASTTMNQQESLNLTENTSKNEDESSFSFELNDFTNSTKNESIVSVPEPPQPTMPAIRAPTCADVAYRALVKRRTNGRVSQPVKAQSPLAEPNKPRSSAPNARFLRSSCRRISTDSSTQSPVAQEQTPPPTTTNECFVNNEAEASVNKSSELIEMVSVPEEDENEEQKTMTTTLNRISTKPINETNPNVSEQMETPIKPMTPVLSREYTFHTSKRQSSQRHRSVLNATPNPATPSEQITPNEIETKSPSIASRSMLNVLLTQPTEQNTSTTMDTLSLVNSPSIPSESMLNILLTKPTETRKSKSKTPVRSPANSMLNILLSKPTETRKSKSKTPVRSPANSMLNILLSKPTQTESRPSTRKSKILTPSKSATNSPSVLSKSMLGVLLTEPAESEQRISSRKSKRLSTNLTPRGSINPLHSSTPSTTRNKSLQMVSIGEQEQILTTVPAVQEEIPIVQMNETEQSIRKSTPRTRTIDAGVQTTPSLNYVTRRYFDSIDEDSIPIYEMNKSASSVVVQEKEVTPLQAKIVMNLKRNVRFQLTPTTDARLAEKEKLEEALRGLKPDVVIEPLPIVAPVVVVKPEIRKPVKRLQKAKKGKKKVLTPRKKKAETNKKPAEKKPQEVKHVSPKKQTKAAKVEVVPTKKVSQRKRANTEPIVEPIAAKRSKPAEVRVTSSKARTASTNNKKNKTESTKRQRSPSKSIEKKKQKPTATKVDQPEPKRNSSKTKKVEQPAPVQVEPKPVAAKPTKKNARKEKVAAAATAPVIAENKPEGKKQTRSASANNKNTTVQPPVEEKRKSLKTNKKDKVEPVEKPQPVATLDNKAESTEKKRSSSINNKKVTPEPLTERKPRAQTRSAKNKTDVVAESAEPAKKSKKRAVEKKETEKEKPIVKNVESNEEQRKKMEELTVAELKSRLNKQKQDIPKGAKKADLIALLMKQDTPIVKEQKPVEAPTVMRTRRHKK